MLVTLREAPADAEIISHQLLLRGGFIKRVGSGVYAYLPLMWRVLQKISKIVQEEMNDVGALQTLLPQLHPSELWKKTGRWEGYTKGEGIMFHLKDRQGREIGLGPTHEEVITKIAGDLIRSYKQLPLSLYQIQTKFRDEIRPRFGLMRSREFIMKDAYSFHKNEEDLENTYNKMHKAYSRIFSRCGIDTVAVDADSGAIGGAASKEFMVTADSGEDLILISTDGSYAANQEKAISVAVKSIEMGKGEMEIIETHKQVSINDLCKNQNIEPSQILKVVAMIAILEDNQKQPVLITIRGDQEVNETKVKNQIIKETNSNVLSLSRINSLDLKEEGIKDIPFGSIGPDLSNNVIGNAKNWNNSFIRLVDHTAIGLDSFVCGANKEGKHRIRMNWEILGIKPNAVDIRKALKGDSCVHNKELKLEERRGIEVGHIFQLGLKYSKALSSTFTNENGEEENLWMGCYGIGVSRLAQAAIEQSHDKYGIIWPLPIAPFEVIIVIANTQNELQNQLGESIYLRLKEFGIDTLLDDRDERAGVKFKDSELIGIPLRLVIGRDAASGKVELSIRKTQETKLMTTFEAVEKIKNEVKAMIS